MKSPRIKAQALKGFQDFLPGEMVARAGIIEVIRKIYERFGFVQLDTPVIEHMKTSVPQIPCRSRISR
jgi:histidyl-tRNA synthetase